MDAKTIISKVEGSSVYKEWRKNKDKPYLAHVFVMYDNDNLADMQVGYFDEDNAKMASFVLSGEKVTLVPEADVFQKPDTSIKKINPDEVSFELDDAIEKAKGHLGKKYAVLASKTILILQNIDSSLVWNITFLTSSFSTVNMRIDPKSGDIIKDEEINLISRKEPGERQK